MRMPGTSAIHVEATLVAGALGDAVGSLWEGAAPSDERLLLQRGLFTDDTELTLATCEAVVDAGDVDPEVIARKLGRWFREWRVHGAGASTTKALKDLAAGAHWALAGARGEYSAGAGAATRAGCGDFVGGQKTRTTLAR